MFFEFRFFYFLHVFSKQKKKRTKHVLNVLFVFQNKKQFSKTITKETLRVCLVPNFEILKNTENSKIYLVPIFYVPKNMENMENTKLTPVTPKNETKEALSFHFPIPLRA